MGKAFPNAAQPGLITLGPQWNAARSVHHRVAWLARESSKPGRDHIERWTVQASAAWSQEHLEDAPERVQAKLIKAFSEITGIRALMPVISENALINLACTRSGASSKCSCDHAALAWTVQRSM